MPSLPDSSSTAPDSPSTRSSQAASLEAGLAAFKQGNYAEAIALLEPAPLTHAQAQMGLAIAYARTGEPLKAAALCRSLQQSENSQLRQWAEKTLGSLARRFPEVSGGEVGREGGGETEAEDKSGFVAFDASGFLDQPAPPQETGFVPIEPSSPAAIPTSQPVPPASNSQPLTRSPHLSPRPHRDRSEDSVGTPSRSFGRSPQPPQPDYQPVWRQAGRAKAGKSLGKAQWVALLLVQGVTAIALFWTVQQGLYLIMLNWSITLTKIPFLGLRRDLFYPMTWPIVAFLGLLFLSSRWLLDGLLMQVYGLRSLPLTELATQSQEAADLLRRWSQQKKFPVPALGILPAPVPIAFSYGLPFVTRIVVSRGLLDQLAEDEIATVYASELGHLWTTPLLSLVAVLLQIPYTLYWMAADWGSSKTAPTSRFSASLVSTIAYGLYSGLRWLGLGLARQRIFLSDRATAELTGNPNGWVRALLKIAIGTAKDVQAQGSTRYLLEGFDLLTPLGHRHATPLGSLYAHTPIEPLLPWDYSQPLRFWLSLNSAHPPTGDRLQRLSGYARQLKLEPELDIKPQVNQKRPLTGQQWRSLLLQGAPFFGLVFGLLAAIFLVGLGWLGMRFRIDRLAWMYVDNSLRWALPWIGFSLGTLVRINPFFRDLPAKASATSLTELLKPVDRQPLTFTPVQLEGKLLDRPGLAGALAQDLWLRTASGIVRLHWVSRWGPIGNLFPQPNRPGDLVNQTVTVTGWFRRGATPWIDVETLRTASGRVSRSDHPVWSLVLATIAALWGVALIVQGR